MINYNPFGEEYRSLTPSQLWNKYLDYREGREELPETIGQWKEKNT